MLVFLSLGFRISIQRGFLLLPVCKASQVFDFLLGGLEVLENLDLLLDGAERLAQVVVSLLVRVSDLFVEVLAIRHGHYACPEERLDDNDMLRLERVAVGDGERLGKLSVRVVQAVVKSLRDEVESAVSSLVRDCLQLLVEGALTGLARPDPHSRFSPWP